MSGSLQPHESQHARPPCPSPTPGVHSDSRPSSRWCHPAISWPVVPFSSCPSSLPESGSFPMSQLLAWSGQSIEVSASASVLPMNTQDWSPLRWTGWTIVWPQVNRREGTQPHPSIENWIKDLLSRTSISEQDPVSLSVGLSHQEAFKSLLSFSNRGQADWKPQSQKLELAFENMCMCELSCCSVRLFVTPWIVVHQALCPWKFPGKNDGVFSIPFSRGSSQPRDWTLIFFFGR